MAGLDLSKKHARREWLSLPPRAVSGPILGAIFLLGLLGCEQDPTTNAIAFVNVNVVNVELGQTLADQTVVVEGERIAEVGPSAEVEVPNDAEVIDGSGRYLMPGLWDMHVHLFDPDTPGDVQVTFPLLIANGITGVRDTGSMFDLLQYWRDEVEAGRVVGPRIVGTGQMIDGVPVIYAPISTVARTPEDARRIVQTMAWRGADFVKAYEMLRPEVFAALVDEANRLNLPVAAHVPLSMLAGDVSAAGIASMEHFRNIEFACARDAETLLSNRQEMLEHGTSRIGMELRGEIRLSQRAQAIANYDAERCDALLELFVANETYQVPTLLYHTWETRRPDQDADIAATFEYLPAIDRDGWAALAMRVDNYTANEIAERTLYSDWLERLVRLMRDAEIPMLAGTDVSVPWMVPGFSLHEELGILVDAGLTPAEALKTATVNAAAFLDVSNDFGSVSGGQIADLVLLDADPLAEIGNTTVINGVMARGVYFDRLSLDRMLESARTAAASGEHDRPTRPFNP